MKLYLYVGRGDEDWAPLLHERIAEEGGRASETLKHLVKIALVTTDAREDLPPVRDEHPDTFGVYLRLTMPLLVAISEDMVKRKLNQAATIRAKLHEGYGVPFPEKVKRAPRDPELTNAIITESQAESFNDMRNLRSSPQPKERTWGEQVLDGPDVVFKVCDCFVPGCKEHDCTWHPHLGKELLIRAQQYMPKED